MKTLAIVVGNDAYFEGSTLNNAINDAKGMSDVFARLGYDVILRKDINAQEVNDLLELFEEKINEYDASIFYFAGHGFQVEGENYLASIECQVANPTKYDCRRTCIRLSEILDIFKKTDNKLNIAIIDACRKSFDRGGSANFSPILAPKGSLIAFSTSPGEGAKDQGFEGHSLYTGALLNFIGREHLSVEELFKKVRKTVFNMSDGQQTTWEHTSLIGDFFFNTGQIVHSIGIPYSEEVVKDRLFESKGNAIGKVIDDLRTLDWNTQNPAANRLSGINIAEMDKNEMFILGRNLLQAALYAFGVGNFFEDLRGNLNRFNIGGENHVLNGMLFEIYFDSNGDFRHGNFKKHELDKIFALRALPAFARSFEFIQTVLQPYREELFYLPGSNDIIDVDVLATSKTSKGFNGVETAYQIVESIKIGASDLMDGMRQYDLSGTNEQNLKQTLSHYLAAPKDLVHIINNIPLKKIFLVTPTEKKGSW